MKGISSTVNGSAISLNLYPATVTPSLPSRQVSVGQFPVNNPNFSRILQISDEYVFVKNGTYAVAIPLTTIVALALTQELGLTWTPPVILSQPANVATTTTVKGTITASIGSERAMTYAWKSSSDGTTFSDTIATGTGIFIAAPSAAGTGYTVGDVLTISGGTSSVAATVVVTSISGGGSTGPVTGVRIKNTGTYTVNPSATAATTGGTGTSATIALKFATYSVATAQTIEVTPAASATGVVYFALTTTDDAASPGSITTNAATLTVT